ncbi:hemolysin family protein [Aquicella lusitana]|uniref:CBS domain containing-hemolysin-like protein n=1 Tax=Aquicella lusitana TaxID=254246 RepID=A0A370G0K8_9COXI|nr:hemolysin family protein [Aquicella lusitana]RDI37272.1 CBS domain containing-hemolysin-like protein [Aquicella lusitana]VVC73647.1 Hemolysin C [Aquicella lusitana]
MGNLFYIIIAFSLVLLNAFFVAAEFGMVKLRHTRVAAIKKQYGLRGKILAEVHKHLDAYLSACQLGITLASLGLGWVGEPAFAHIFEPGFEMLGLSAQGAATATAVTTAFLFITFLHIVIGELVPKSLAIRQSEIISLWTALPLYGFYWLMYPIIWLMNTCANAVINLTKLGKMRAGEQFYSTDEIRLILHGSYIHGELTSEERKILEHTLELGDLKVTDVMRPVDEMVALTTQQSVAEALRIMNESRYSRYPVYENESDQIMGIIHVKDVFAALYQNKEITSLKNIIRPVLKVSRRLPLMELLRKFREGMPHFALIYSGKEENLIGFVTLDNLLHVLVGRIQDEFHRTRDDWVKDKDGSYIMRGNASIYTLERALDIDIEIENIEEEIDTLNGLILSRLESIPKSGQRIAFDQFEILIEKMRGPRILQVRVYPKNKQD